MKQNFINSMIQCVRAAWNTLKQAPFICLVQTDSPSKRTAVTASAWCGPMPLWSNCQVIISRSAEDGALC